MTCTDVRVVGSLPVLYLGKASKNTFFVVGRWELFEMLSGCACGRNTQEIENCVLVFMTDFVISIFLETML